MTTIAFDGKILASDSRAIGNYIKDDYKKIFKINNKCYGITGNYSSSLLFIEWIKNGGDKPKLDENNGVFEIELMSQKAFYYGEYLIKVPQSIPCALGSGSVAAMAAMLSGKNACEAIEIAKLLDIYTGGKIQYYTINKLKRTVKPAPKKGSVNSNVRKKAIAKVISSRLK